MSSAVSFSGDDVYLSYLPEFRAKTESASNPLPRSFVVKSLRDFVGNLPDELLLCPVRALRIYLRRTSSLSPRPRSLFVSPRAPTRPLSMNALSFFIRSVILQSLPSPPPSSSSIRAHTVRSVSTSTAFVAMCLFPLSLQPLPGVLPPYSHPFICVMFSLLRIVGFLWVLLLLWVQLCKCFSLVLGFYC